MNKEIVCRRHCCIKHLSYHLIFNHLPPKMAAMEFDFLKLFQILFKQDRWVQLVQEDNLLPSSVWCHNAGCMNSLCWTRQSSLRDRYEWRCSRSSWYGIPLIRHNSWFYGTRLSFWQTINPATYASAQILQLLKHETSSNDETKPTETVVNRGYQ